MCFRVKSFLWLYDSTKLQINFKNWHNIYFNPWCGWWRAHSIIPQFLVYRQKGNLAKRHQLPFWQSLWFSCQKGNHSLSKRQLVKNRLFCWYMESLACYIVMDWVKMTCTILVSVVSQEWTHILSLRWISTPFNDNIWSYRYCAAM